MRGSSLPCVPPRVPITCCAPYLPTSRHRTHAATTTQFGSACVTFWASRMTEIPKSPPPDASRFCQPASADSDFNVRSASLLPHTGLRGPTLCPFCGCVAPKLLRVAWPNSKPDQPPLPCAYALPLQPVPTSPTQDGRVGPSGALSMTACGRPTWRAVPGLAASRFSRLFNPFSRHRVAAGPRAARAGAAAFAVWAARCRMARHRPQRGRHHNTTRPHAHRLRRRLRLPLPVAQGRCAAHGPGCGAAVDVYSDHYAACPRTGLLARRAKPLERAYFVAYGATQLGEALCCDVMLVSPLARDGHPQPSSTTRDGARRGPQRLNDESLRLVAPFASLACSCSAPRSCHPGLVQAVVGPAQCGCAKHACCHFARDAARRRQSTPPPCLARRRRICRTSCTTRARLCPAACRPAEPQQPRCSAV